MSPISTQPRIYTSNRGPAKSCEFTPDHPDDGPPCKATTREGKPFCPDHVDSHDYVQNIQNQILTRNSEWEAVRKKGKGGWEAVDVRGTTAKEILLLLTMQGSRTIKRISREVNLDNSLVGSYVEALEKAGFVQTGHTTRGCKTVALSKK